MAFQRGHKAIGKPFQKGHGRLRKSYLVTEETKRKISKSEKGKMISKEIKKKMSQNSARYWLGRKLPKESIEKRSKARKGKKLLKTSGRKHWNWKGGTTPKNKKVRKGVEFRLWREAVFARDNWTCQKYGIKGGKLHPHHIKNFAQYPELRFALDNGITFSEKAHREFHKKYGRKNNTREQLEEFLKGRIK